MTPAQRVTYRTYMSLVIAAAHAAFAFLGIIGRLTYAIPSHYAMLREIMTNDVWIWLHAIAALAIIVALLTGRREVTTVGASVGIWASWSFLSLMWGLSTEPPVALVSPVLGTVVTILAYLLCLSWATKPDSNNLGE